MKSLAIIFLGLIALFTGGCSLLASPLIFSVGTNGGAMLFWLSGFLVAAICIFAINAIMAGDKPKTNSTQPIPSLMPKPPNDPKKDASPQSPDEAN